MVGCDRLELSTDGLRVKGAVNANSRFGYKSTCYGSRQTRRTPKMRRVCQYFPHLFPALSLPRQIVSQYLISGAIGQHISIRYMYRRSPEAPQINDLYSRIRASVQQQPQQANHAQSDQSHVYPLVRAPAPSVLPVRLQCLVLPVWLALIYALHCPRLHTRTAARR